MFVHCELLMLILTLTLDGQVHAGEIIGGQEAVPHSRPYMVLVEHLQNGKTGHCGGFLLSEDFVMTAAHCQADSGTVSLGVHNVRDKSEIQRISVEKSFPHKDYNETYFRNDIMLLKLSSKAKFSQNVRPIALAGQGDGSLPKNCVISGWGRSVENEKYLSDVLMEVNVTLIDNKMCVENNAYCSEGRIGPGEGDSGGPLVCEDGKAYGVVSTKFKPRSGGPDINLFTKISDYRSWIYFIMTKA